MRHVSSEPTIHTSMLQRLRLRDDQSQEYFLYVPSRGGKGAATFVTVHGISRNADVHAEKYVPFAEQYGVVLVAPLFPESRYPDYQCFGRTGRGERADLMLERILAEVSQLTGANTENLYLFGYSGGGQFVHRFTMAYPHRVARVVVGAAGWYTFPDAEAEFPHGLQPTADLPGLRFDPAAFVTVPTMVVVGENDIARTANLNQTPEVDDRQGLTRLERGRRWAEEMRRVAEELGVPGNYAYRVVPSAAHSFSECMEAGGMGPVVFEFLFQTGR